MTPESIRQNPRRPHWFTYRGADHTAVCQCGWTEPASDFQIAWTLYQAHEHTHATGNPS